MTLNIIETNAFPHVNQKKIDYYNRKLYLRILLIQSSVGKKMHFINYVKKNETKIYFFKMRHFTKYFCSVSINHVHINVAYNIYNTNHLFVSFV